MEPRKPTTLEQASNIMGAFMLGALLVGGCLFARKNLRLGRGDRRGAARLAIFVFGLNLMAWILTEQHVSNFWEIMLVMMFLGWGLFISGMTWVLYVALEPFVRRRWPRALVSWSRLLSGGLRDPLVGRDILVGCVAAAFFILLDAVGQLLPGWLGLVPEMPNSRASLSVLLGSNFFLGSITLHLFFSIFFGLAFLFFLFLCRVLLRKEWLAVTAFVLILALPPNPFSENLLLSMVFSLLITALQALLLLRVGLLATIAAMFFGSIFYEFPITAQLSAWYSGIGIASLALLIGLTVYAFHTSLGGQPVFGGTSLED